MKYLNLNILGVMLAGLFFAGCNEPHKAPPLEQMELTARFFNSIRNRRSDAAIRQANKLIALDPDASYISSLISIQEANDTIADAQKALNKGDINKTIEIVRAGRRKHADNATFAEVYPKVSQLRNAQKLFLAMSRAKNASAMRGARIAAKAGLSMNLTPELEKFLIEYEARGTKLAAKEKADAAAKELAAKKAAAKAAADEKQRKISEKKFSHETAEKSAEGERLRRDNKFPQ